MKLSADKLKNIDWKQVGVDHGEKIALGTVGLVVVWILFSGTRWATYKEKKPADIVTEVKTQQTALTNATWPEPEQVVFTESYDVNNVYDNTYSDVLVSDFRYPLGQGMTWPLHRKQEPIEEPTWLAVREMIATAGTFILELPPAGQVAVTNAPAAIKAQQNNPMGNAQVAAIKAALGGQPPVAPGAGVGVQVPPANTDAVGSSSDVNSRGMRYIAARGLFPFREQAIKIMNARHNPTQQNLWAMVQLLDFEIQRQTAQPGPNPWSNADKDWTTLDVSIATNVLAETVDYAEDFVAEANRSQVITSPLPARLVGNWTAYFVGHPKIKSISEKEQELQRQINEQIVKLSQEVVTEDKATVRGFAGSQIDIRGIQRGFSDDGNQKRQLLKNLQQQGGSDNQTNSEVTTGVEGMLTQSNEVPEFILFRYLDFDVEPGQAYRYRVRLKLANPNFNELPENLAAENVGKGEVRETPWSEASQVAILPEDSKFFVDSIIPPTTRKEAKAKIDLYHWVSDIGTTANKVVEVQVGQMIGQPMPELDSDGKAVDEDMRVEILRPWKSFKEEPVELVTRDVLVDLVDIPGTARDRDFHADLDIRGKRPEWKYKVLPLSQALVANQFGELENLNPLGQQAGHAIAKEILSYEHGPWESYKDKGEAASGTGSDPDDPNSDLISAGGLENGTEAAGSGRPQRRGRGTANPRRLNRP